MSAKAKRVKDPLDRHVTRRECQAICVAVIHRMMSEIAAEQDVQPAAEVPTL